jgi:predicted GNAT family acetyltransferase
MKEEELEKQILILEKLLERRQKVLDTIPPCPKHGAGCIYHALEWIEEAKKVMKAKKTSRHG